MSGTAVIGSAAVGICFGHDPPIPMTGTIITGSTTVICENSGAAGNGDLIMGLCGHTGVLVSTSLVNISGSSKGKVGDSFVGTFTGTITSGVDTVQIGG